MTIGKQNQIKFWDTVKDQPICLNPPLKEKVLDLQQIHSINAIAIATLDKTISIWCLKKYELRFVVKSQYQRHIHKLAYSQIFQKLFTVGYSGVIDVWKFDNSKQCTHIQRVSGHNSPILTIELIEDLLLTIDEQGIMKSWSVKTMECLQSHAFQQNLRVTGIQQLNMASFCVYGSRIVLFNCKLVEIAKDGTGMSDIKINQNNNEENKQGVVEERMKMKFNNSISTNTKELLSKIGKTALKAIEKKQNPKQKQMNSIEIVDVSYNWVSNQLVIATRADVRLMNLSDGRQKKIFTFLLRYLEDITSFSVDPHLRKFFVGGHYGALKCFTYNNATVLKEFPLITGQVSYLNIDFKNQLLVTASFDQNFIQVQRIPTDQGTFQSLRVLKNPTGKQQILKIDISHANNAIMVVCVEAALIYHYESLQFKGFCDTLFFQDKTKKFNKTGSSSSSFNLTTDFNFDGKPKLKQRRNSTKNMMNYQIRNATFLGDYQLAAVVCNHKNNQNDCHTMIYKLQLDRKQIQRFEPVIHINHQSNPYFDSQIKERAPMINSAVTHISFKLFERVPPNTPRFCTALGNYPKQGFLNSFSSQKAHLNLAGVSINNNNMFSHPQFNKNKPPYERKMQSFLAFGKSNGLIQLFNLSQLLKQFKLAFSKDMRQPYRQINENSMKFLNQESIFETQTYMNSKCSNHNIQLREQNYSSPSFVREWPAHHEGVISMVKLEQVQNQRVIISASEDGFIKLWSKSGRLLACSNINEILPSVWKFKFNTKKKRICSMYKAKLVYDSVVRKYTEIAGTKLIQSDKLRPSSTTMYSPEKTGDKEKMQSINQIEEEQHLILKDAVQRYIQMKKSDENKQNREQNDLDIKLLRHQLGLTNQSGSSWINRSSVQMDISSLGALNSMNISAGMNLNDKHRRENSNFIQNLDVMIHKSKNMDGNIHQKLEQYKSARENIVELEQNIDRVKSIDVIKELGDVKKKNKEKSFSDNLARLIKNKWNRAEKEDFKNILKVTTRKYFLKKAKQQTKRSKSSVAGQSSSCRIVKKIDDSKVSANKTELIKYAKAKNAAIGSQIDLAKNTLPNGRPNSLQKFQIEFQKQQEMEHSIRSSSSAVQNRKLPQPKIKDLLALMNSTVQKYKSQRIQQNLPGDDIPMLHLLNISQPQEAQKYLTSAQKKQLKDKSISLTNLNKQDENEKTCPIYSARDQSTFITETKRIESIGRSARNSKSLSRQSTLSKINFRQNELNQAFREEQDEKEFQLDRSKALCRNVPSIKRNDYSMTSTKKKRVYIKPTFLKTQRRIQTYSKIKKKDYGSYDLSSRQQLVGASTALHSSSRQFISRNMQGTLGTLPSIFEERKDFIGATTSFAFEIPETKKVNQQKFKENLYDDDNDDGIDDFNNQLL